MRNFPKYFFLLFTLFLACENNVQKENVESDSKHSIDFIKTFEGKINNQYSIIAKIQANNGAISGGYFYTKVGQELNLKGTFKDGTLLFKEFDNQNNHTGSFSGVLVNENKIEGTWSKATGNDSIPFYLIESNTSYDILKDAKNKTSIQNKNLVKILYRQEEFVKDLNTNLPVLKVNHKFLETADDGIRAIVAYYSSISGTDCWWENDNANAEYTNLNCMLTSALNLGHQCSKSHKSFMQKWFSEEEEILEQIEECYFVPYTATSQTTYDYLNLEMKGDEIIIEYKIEGANARTQSFWERKGTDRFKIIGDKIKVISREKQ